MREKCKFGWEAAWLFAPVGTGKRVRSVRHRRRSRSDSSCRRMRMLGEPNGTLIPYKAEPCQTERQAFYRERLPSFSLSSNDPVDQSRHRPKQVT